MAVEAKRGCGYRKAGGTYMVGGELSAPCGRLPLELHVCPVCNSGIKQTRGWTWIKPRVLFKDARECALKNDSRLPGNTPCCFFCPLNPENLPERAGLLWIGEQFYPTPAAFMREAFRMGISRRITAIPRDFKLGETWVMFAHPKAIVREPRTADEIAEAVANSLEAVPAGGELELRHPAQKLLIVRKGVIATFLPTRIEKIFNESERGSEAVQEAEARGITPVFVPDDDPDHHNGADA